MNNFLLYIGVVLVLIFSFLFGVPYIVDWNSYRGVFEEEASRVLGREVRVAGNVELKLLPSPYFKVEKIRIGNATGGELSGSYFKADDFRVWISIPPLLKGVLEAKSVELTRPVIQTALDTDGRLAVSPSQWKQAGVYSLFTNIALQSVKIIDGSFGFVSPNATDLLRLDQVNGELSADALDGPFRFAGQYFYKDEIQQIRINTGKSDDKGVLRFKAQVISPNSTNTYTLEAAATDLFGRPSIEGDLKGKINAAYVLSKSLSGQPHLDFEKVQQALNLELNSRIMITGSGVSLDEITLNSESLLPPKLFNGRSRITWKDQLAVDMFFSSEQIDFDKILVGDQNENMSDPLEFLPAFTGAVVSQWPKTAKVKFELAIDNLSIKKQNIKDFHLSADTVEGSVHIKEARAQLPGEMKFLLSGEISGDKGARNLLGNLSLDGERLNHFLSWFSTEKPTLKFEEEIPLSLTGEIRATTENLQLSKIKVLSNSTPLKGDVTVSFEDRPQIKLDLQSEKIDLDTSGPRNILNNLDSISGALPLGENFSPQKSARSEALKTATWVQKLDWEVHLKSDVLRREGAEVQNFEWAATSKNQNFVLSKIMFQSPNELSVALQAPNSQGAAPTKRTLEGKVEVLSLQGEEKIFKLLKSSEDFKSRFKNLAALTPWNFDCVFNYDDSNDMLLDFSLRGTLGKGRAELSGLLHNPFGDWRKGSTKLTATVEAPKVRSLFVDRGEEMFGASDLQNSTLEKLFVTSEGKPLEGMITVEKIQTKDSNLEFKGSITLTEDNIFLRNGALLVDSTNLNDFVLITGLLPPWSFQTVPIKGTLVLQDDGKKVHIKSDKIVIGETSSAGELSWHSEGRNRDKLSALEANISADHISVPSLLSFLAPVSQKILADAGTSPVGQAEALKNSLSTGIASKIGAEKNSIWPDASFDYRFLKKLDGVVKLNAETLNFQPQVAIKNAQVEILLGGDETKIKLVVGEAFGGKAVSDFQIKPQPLGLFVKGQLALEIPEGLTSAKGGSQEKKMSLSASVKTNFEGRASNPRTMIDMLVGKGQLDVNRMILQGEGPKAVIEASKVFLQDKISNTQTVLADSIKAKLKNEKWEIKNISVPVEIVEGQFKIGKIEVHSEYGNSSLQTELDLQTLDILSSWTISPVIPDSDKEFLAKSQKKTLVKDTFLQLKNVGTDALPVVNITYSGGLGNISAIEPKIMAEALERELVVRRLELDVKELENLRKRDEEKAKLLQPPIENEKREDNSPKENLNSNLDQKDLQPADKGDVGHNSDQGLTASTKSDATSNLGQNLDLNEKKAEDPSLTVQTQEGEANLAPLNKDQQNLNTPTPPQGAQKINKKKTSDSYWPSFDFWPF